MIQADKQLIQSQLKQSSLQVRRKELKFFTSNFESLGTTSALMASMSFSALSNNIPDDTHWVVSGMFHCFCTLALMFSLWCLCNCIGISMFGPGLALRGPDGSMHKAVEGMMEERVDVYLYFRIGILFIHLATAMLIWCFRHQNAMGYFDGTMVTGILIFSLYKLNVFTTRIQLRFDFKQIENKKMAGILETDLYQTSPPNSPRQSMSRRKSMFDPDNFTNAQEKFSTPVQHEQARHGTGRRDRAARLAAAMANEGDVDVLLDLLEERLQKKDSRSCASRENSAVNSAASPPGKNADSHACWHVHSQVHAHSHASQGRERDGVNGNGNWNRDGDTGMCDNNSMDDASNMQRLQRRASNAFSRFGRTHGRASPGNGNGQSTRSRGARAGTGAGMVAGSAAGVAGMGAVDERSHIGHLGGFAGGGSDVIVTVTGETQVMQAMQEAYRNESSMDSFGSSGSGSSVDSEESADSVVHIPGSVHSGRRAGRAGRQHPRRPSIMKGKEAKLMMRTAQSASASKSCV